MIIVVGNSKGGVSKSTMATNLAAALANKSDDVCLVAGNKHVRTTSRWAEDRAETELPKITFIEQLGDLNEVLLELDNKYKHVVVDPAGKDSREFRTALSVAHIAVVPLLPSSLDVDILEDLTPVLNEAQQLNPSLQVYMLLTRASTNIKSRSVQSARESLAHYDEFTVLNAVAHERNIYREALGSGRGVMEIHRRPSESRDKQLATAEIESILLEIMSQRNCQPRKTATAAAIKEFASGANEPKTQQQPVQTLNPDAPRHRRTQYLFNDYEHDLIYRAAKVTYRSMQAFMRSAVIQEARKVLGE